MPAAKEGQEALSRRNGDAATSCRPTSFIRRPSAGMRLAADRSARMSCRLASPRQVETPRRKNVASTTSSAPFSALARLAGRVKTTVSAILIDAPLLRRRESAVRGGTDALDAAPQRPLHHLSLILRQVALPRRIRPKILPCRLHLLLRTLPVFPTLPPRKTLAP